MNDLPFERAFRRWCDTEGMRWTTSRYSRRSAGGETLAHRFTPRASPRGAVLVVHGAGNDALFSLTGLFAELLRDGYEIFSFDVDGHGRANSTRLSVGAAGEIIPAALEAWAPQRALVPVHAVGISLGGSLLLHALGSLETPVTSATLICAPLRVELAWRSIRREIGVPLLRTIWRERSRFGITGLIPSFGPFRRDVYPLRLAEPAGPGSFGYVEVINRLLDSLDLRDAARSTRVPVLLVYGARDLLVPPSQARELAGLIPSSELLLLPRETHLSTPLAPATRARLLSWLERHQAANHSVA